MITTLHGLSLQERNRCWREILLILDAKTCVAKDCYPSNLFDHFDIVHTQDKQIFVFDNPFIWSQQLQGEPALLIRGWRVLHLPLHMTWYTAGKCQPRLMAPPSSRVDLAHLESLLVTAGFVGNFALTQDYIDGGHECGGLKWQKLWAAEIAAPLFNILDPRSRNTQTRLKRSKS